jgi:hypothetical protein
VVQYRYNPAFSHRSVSSSYVSVYLKSLSPQICCGKKFGETPTKYNTLLTARNEIRKLKTLMTTGIRVTGIYYTSGSSKDVWNVKTATSGSILVQFQLGSKEPLTYPKIRVSRAQYPCMSQTVEQLLKSLHGLGRWSIFRHQNSAEHECQRQEIELLHSTKFIA